MPAKKRKNQPKTRVVWESAEGTAKIVRHAADDFELILWGTSFRSFPTQWAAEFEAGMQLHAQLLQGTR